MEEPISVYQAAINNTANYITSAENQRALSHSFDPMDTFTASWVLAAAFCKQKEDVFFDLINACRAILCPGASKLGFVKDNDEAV